MSAFQLSHGTARKSGLLGTTVFCSGFLRIALVTAAALGATARADAAVFWTDEDPMVMRQIEPPAPRPQPRLKIQRRAKVEKLTREQEKARPVGPLTIAISIEQQKLRLYDANGLFAETSVSTGMRGHSTPMGVFSIIQKNKFHKSNIYSGAPMPFMQRITWSGIALHAGVLPGYPASHGCIRMPMAFATKIWGWTRMGARVIIAPGEVSPADFSHPLLATQKPGPVVATIGSDATTTAKSDKAISDKAAAVKPAELDRSKTQTADASATITPSIAAAPTMSDATSGSDTKLTTRQDLDAQVASTTALPVATKPAEPAADTAAKPEPAKSDTAAKDETRPADAAKAPAKADTASPAADVAPKRTGQIAVLVSGKDNKMYVRQNFAPLFETPIVIKPSDRPLGTHIFTARIDKDDAKQLHWTAVTMPTLARRADDEDKAARRRKNTGAIEVKEKALPDSAAEALDRLTIPADAMAQIVDALGSGGSIVVSDAGIAAGGETGQGTEFVVPLR